MRRFKDGEIDVLLATDVAARGLDIHDVKTVINFTMPNTIQHYVHRVGRTARAGRSGRYGMFVELSTLMSSPSCTGDGVVY